MNIIKIVILLLITVESSYGEAIPASKLFQAEKTEDVKLSPDAKYFVIKRREVNRTVLTLTSTETLDEYEIIHFPTNKNNQLKGVVWLDKQSLLVRYSYSYGFGSSDSYSILKIKVNEGVPTATPKHIKARGYVVDPLANTENKVLFALLTDADNANKYSLVYMNHDQLSSGSSKHAIRFSKNTPKAAVFISNNRGKDIMAVKLEGTNAEIYYKRSQFDGWKRTGHLPLNDNYFLPVGFIDDEYLAVLSNKDSDTVVLREFSLVDSRLGKILASHPSYDIVSAETDSDSQSVKWVRYFERNKLVTRYFDSKDQKAKRMITKALPGKQFVFLSQLENSQFEILYSFSSSSPGKYYLFDRKNLTAGLIGEARPELKGYKFSSSEVIRVAVSDGIDVEATITYPSVPPNGVLLVNPHGGPIGVRDYDQFQPELQYYASRGYTVLQVNYRGSTGYGRKFLDAGRGELGKVIEQDINKVVDHLFKSAKFKHVCAMGSSYGAYSSVMLAIFRPQRYSCVAASFGIYDLPLLFNYRNLDKASGMIKATENVVGKMRPELWDLSPLYKLEELQAPLLIVAGVKDPVASIEHSNRLRYRARQLGKTEQSLFYKSAGHGHYSWFGDRHEAVSTSQFFERILGLSTTWKTKEILVEESTTLADGFSDGTFLPEDPSKAIKHYRKAANLGDARSQFVLAQNLERGVKADTLLKQAVGLYIQSSETGYHKASYRLGELYADRFGLNNLLLSYKYYKIAWEQGNDFAALETAKMQCLSRGAQRNFQSCLKIIDSEIKAYKSKTKRRPKYDRQIRQTLASILWQAQLSSEENRELQTVLGRLVKIDSFDVSLDERVSGAFENSRPEYWNGQTLEHSTTLKLRRGLIFGVAFNFLSNSEQAVKQDQIVYNYRWIKPGSADRSGKDIEEYIGISHHKGFHKLTYTISDNSELRPGDWTLELQTLDGKPLYSKTFTLE